MPMKIQKTGSDTQLVVERIHHAKNYKLTLDCRLCVGCELCSLICPREAISVAKQPKKDGQKTQHPIIDVDEVKCHYCGICTAICPYGALHVTIDGNNIASVIEKESFPQLIREITVDATKCPTDCTECEEICPLDLIKVTSDPKTNKVTIEIKEEQCPTCRKCEIKCPEGLIRIRKIFTGKLTIRQEKCPTNCQDCLDVCPITDTLYLSEKDGKVYVNEIFCTYCGACKIVCPEEQALELSRSTIHHTPVRSGAWNKALEKLTSTTEMTKELRGKGRKKTMEAVKKRLEPRAK
ncbi:MAG: 4Fe-4S dicluster domain-containing protein [Candidatus Bathyarchaeota archaeon]|nr:MAG: 4Fe-4S dicluster domain-containing protein [Candidatus Bathyarchaeota archaeon]